MAKASDVLEFLKEIGYETKSEDENLVIRLMGAVSSTILNQCNISEIPTDLDNVVIMRTCGAFLKIKSATSDLTTTLNVAPAYKRITEGDVTVELSVQESDSPQKQFNNFIKSLEEYGKRDIAAFRKVRW